MTKIVIFDAADELHGAQALGDLFSLPIHLRGSRIVLVDEDASALAHMARYAQRINESQGELFEIEAVTERRAALQGADFVLQLPLRESIETSAADWRVPLRHGVRHLAGRSGGPGALARTLRLMPRLLARVRDVEAAVPQARFVNQAEPLGRSSTLLAQHTSLRWVGAPRVRAAGYFWLSHAFGWKHAADSKHDEHGEEQIMRDAMRRLRTRAAGLHGLSFFLSLRERRSGDDLYPRLRDRLAVALPDFELLSRRLFEVFGLYCTSGDAVVGEFTALAAETMALHGPDVEADLRAVAAAREQVHAVGDGKIVPAYGVVRASQSRAAPLIAALVNDLAYSEAALVLPNEGRMEQLPVRAAIETPAFVAAGELRGEPIGPLPDGVMSLLQRESTIAALAVEAALTGDRATALQALLLDTHVHSYAQATHLLDDLLQVHREDLPNFYS